MIISLEDAQKINKNVTQDDLDAFEQTVRASTNNNFQNFHTRFNIVRFEKNEILTNNDIEGFRISDTIEVNDSKYNDGLYTIAEIKAESLVVEKADFLRSFVAHRATVTLVSYPADILRGIKKLLQYDAKMSDKLGVKSETISRMSLTYFDMNASDNAEGYPKALLSFLDKYRKLRW